MTDDDDDRPDDNAVRARLAAPPARRVVAAGMIAALGALILWIAALHPPAALGWRLFLIAGGAAVLWLAVRLWQATAVVLELTGIELREAGGRRLARIDEIEVVNRGVFALKPSNGFTLVLRAAPGAVWAPGLWWRLGRRVGVGGVTGRFEGRRMADALSFAVDAAKARVRT
jgi:hypothetical protein